jgi:hypothetical protein
MLILWTTTAVTWVVAGLLIARAIRLGDDGMGERTELGLGQASAALVNAQGQFDEAVRDRREAAA